MNSMNQKGLRIFSFILAIILLTLFMPTIPLVADGVDSHTDASPQEESNVMGLLPEEAVDSTGSQYVEATPVEGLEGGIIGEIPSIGDIGNEGPSVELQDYTTVTSAIVPDGVYALRNAGNANRWMDIQQNRVDPGAYVQQYAYSQSPAELFDRAGLYKISRNTTTNTYVIRCMLNNLLTFGFDGNKVVTKYIPSDDAMVDIHDTFTITRSGDGYVIKPYGQSYAVSANNTMNSGAAGAPESYLAKRSEAEAGTRAIWLLEKYIGTQRAGVSYSSSPNIQNGLTKGATSTLTLCVWSTYINAQTPYVEMATAYEDTAFCESTSAENQTLITGNIVGKSQVLFRIRYGSGTALTSYQEDFFVTPPINEANEHFMQNVATKKYMDVEGPSTAVGAYIQQWDFSTAPQKKWVFTKQTGGYYTIQSVYSDLYVGVDSSTSTAVKQYSTVNDYTKWYFSETVSGNYVIHNKAQGDWYVLASSSATAANGSDLTMSIYYNDDNYRDEWIATVLPCSGYEIPYNPAEWSNGNVGQYSNCYNYALNKKNSFPIGVYSFMQPGRAVGLDASELLFRGVLNSLPLYYVQLKSSSTIQSYAMQDAEYFGITFTPIGRYEVCPEGTYKVALVMDLYDDPYVDNRLTPCENYYNSLTGYYGDIFINEPDMDYHWYRQNPDGTWSHKRGKTQVFDTDAAGNVIYDPEGCDRDYGNVDYSIFVGYFAVSSLD